MKGGRSGETQREGRKKRARNCWCHELMPRGPVAKAEHLLDFRIALLAANLSRWCGEGAAICPFYFLNGWQMRNDLMFVSCMGWSLFSLSCHLFSLYQASTRHPDRHRNLFGAGHAGRALSLPGPEIQRPD